MKKLMMLLVMVGIVFPEALIITTPGEYSSNPISFTPTVVGDAMVRISSSNVLLDLQGALLTQDGGSGGLNGIEIDASLDNVTIRNATIDGITGRGIVVGSGCTNLVIEDIVCRNCDLGGLEVNGTSLAPVTNAYISGVDVFDCTNSAISNCIELSFCQSSVVTNCLANNSGNIAVPFSGFELDTCIDCNFEHCFSWRCTGSVIDAFLLNDCERNSFFSCIARENSADDDRASGFTLNSSTQNAFIKCEATRQASPNGSFLVAGFTISDSIQNCFINCQANQNTSARSATGFRVRDSSLDNVFIGCITVGNIGGTNVGTGFVLREQADSGLIYNCITHSHDATTSSGIFVNSETTTANWAILNNTIGKNFGITQAGVDLNGQATAISTYLTALNVGFNNVTNNFDDVPPGSVRAFNTDNINTFTAIWSNLSVTT